MKDRISHKSGIDVRRIRKDRAKMTMDKFAAAFGFSVASLSIWETNPDSNISNSMQKYLQLIDTDPQLMLLLLSGTQKEIAAVLARISTE